MMNKRILFLGIFTLLIIVGCSQNTEKQILGTWQASKDNCDPDISDINRQISFSDNKIAGIDGFQNYEIKKTNNEDYDYAVLSGGYNDTTKFRIKITNDNILKIINDKYDENFDTIRSCHMEKEND